MKNKLQRTNSPSLLLWACCLMFLVGIWTTDVNAQAAYSNNFNANATGWTGTITRTTATTACGSASMRRNMYASVTTGTMISPSCGTSNGALATLSYNYKVANWSANTVGTPNPWGSFNVQYGATAAGPWTTFQTINSGNHIVSGTCSLVTVTFTPPAGALFIKWDAFWSAGDYYINFDDVTVSQSAGGPCAGTPAPGNTIITAGTNPTCAAASFTLGLQNSTAGSGVTYQWQSAPPPGSSYSNIGGATNATYTTTQATATYYQCFVTCSAGPTTTGSNPLQVTMNSGYACYCPATFPSSIEPITLVDFAGINNSTSATVGGTPATENFTAQSANVTLGTSYLMTVKGNTDGNFSTYIRVYIDFNQNGSWADAGESFDIGIITNSTGTDAVQVSANIAIPGGALTGTTFMRVLKLYAGYSASPCNTAGYGQAEDYSVVISAASPAVVSSFLPANACGGSNVVITGNYFTGATQVTFGGTNAQSFIVNSASQITALVSNTGSTGVITVTTPSGPGSSAGSFTFDGASPVSSVQEGSSVAVCSGQSQTLTALPAGNFYLWSTGATTQAISVNTANSYTVTVTNGGGCSSSTSATVSLLAAPAISVTPPLGTTCNGTPLMFTGNSNPVLYSEGFNSGGPGFIVYSPLPADWSQSNQSTPVGTTSWMNGDNTVFAPQSGAGYIAANYNNTGNTGTISNWLIMPNITMNNGDVFKFWTKTGVNPSSFPDRLELRMSTNGASNNVGAGAAQVGDFTTLVLSVNPTLTTTGYPAVWTEYTATISGLGGPASGRLAFRYFVTGAGLSGSFSDYIGIDDVSYSRTLTYAWSGGTPSGNTTSATTAGAYTVTVTDPAGCTATASANLTVNARPTGALTGTQSICNGGTATLSIAATGSGTISGTLNPGAIPYSGTAPTITVGVSPGVITSYTIATMSDANCTSDGGDLSGGATVSFYTTATAPTSVTSDDANNEVCNGTSVLLTANGGAFGNAPSSSYKWYEGGCGTGGVLGSASTLSVTPSVGSHTYYARIEDACGNTTCSSITILVTAGPPLNGAANIVGPSEACNGTVALVTVNPVSGANIHYSWNTGTNSSVVLYSTNIGGPFSPGPYSTPTNQVYAQFGALAGASGYNICVQGVNGCGSTNNKCTWIRGTVSVPGTISGSPVGCPSTPPQPYSCGISAGASVYNWTLSGSAAPITSGQGSANISVTFPPAFTSGQLCVTAALACGGSSTSAPRCMTISNNPSVPAPVTGVSKVCAGATGVSFSVPAVAGATGYNWTVPAGATITNNVPANTITVSFPNPYPYPGGSVCVTATGPCGASVPRCKAVGTSIPAQPGNVTGPLNNICNSTVQYSIANVSGATSYTWTNPAGTTIASGQGSTTILLSVGSSFTTGLLSVTANTTACTPGSGPARTITIVGKPSIPGTISANPPIFCNGGFVNFSVSAVSPLPTYNWTNTIGTITAGQGSNNIDVTWGTGSGFVNVTASNGCGISGVRSQTFSSGCREENEAAVGSGSWQLAVYPNPAHDHVTVSIYVKEAAQFNIKLRDLSGRIILSEDRDGSAGLNTYDMELKHFAKGLYTMEVQSAKENWKAKVVVE